LHLVLDNYGTHKHSRVQAWMIAPPSFYYLALVCPPVSSWLNLVERWFGELTSKRIRRGSFGSVEDLEKAITEFLAAWNENPKPFVWTATVESIVARSYRAVGRTWKRFSRVALTLPRVCERAKH